MLDENFIKDSIKNAEGFRDKVYRCSEGFRTIGFGHKCIEPHWKDDVIYKSKVLLKVFNYDFTIASNKADQLIKEKRINNSNPQVKWVLTEMIFQMGKSGVGKFEKMFTAIRNNDLQLASEEMLNSKWYHQTPNRARKLSDLMKSIV